MKIRPDYQSNKNHFITGVFVLFSFVTIFRMTYESGGIEVAVADQPEDPYKDYPGKLRVSLIFQAKAMNRNCTKSLISAA